MELPHIEHFYREMKSQGFGLITITSDKAPDVLKMVEYNGITHPIVSDTTDPATGQVFKRYHAYDGKHYLIDSDGKIVATFSKLGISLPVLKRVLERHGINASANSAPAAATPAPASRALRSEAQAPVVWKAAARPTAAAAGGAIAVTVSASVAPGWHLYATTQSGSGPEPLAVTLQPGAVFAMAGAMKSPLPSVKFDPNFRMDVASHEDRADFELPVSVVRSASSGAHTLVVEARYQTCNAVICLPPRTDVLKVPVVIK